MTVDETIISIRKTLHQKPELSREEAETSAFVVDFFSNLTSFTLIQNLGYHSLVAYRKFGNGPKIAFRAELDALPINEESDLDYRSKSPGKSHLCGHDGHMSILLALAKELNDNNPKNGAVYFIFQSAEETGEGAAAMVENEEFQNLNIDICYALHNIPGLKMGSVHSKVGSFACASVGLTIKIIGKTAHAAHPEDAVNPLDIAMELWSEISALPKHEKVIDFALVTSIGLNSGDKNFGTSPANAELMLTMRAARTSDLKFMQNFCEDLASQFSSKYKALIKLDFQEYFPATENADLLDNLTNSCVNAGVDFGKLEKPFRWSEDFAHFSKCFPTLMFGLGSGLNQPALHAPDFDFPDELIETGKSVFYELYNIHTTS